MSKCAYTFFASQHSSSQLVASAVPPKPQPTPPSPQLHPLQTSPPPLASATSNLVISLGELVELLDGCFERHVDGFVMIVELEEGAGYRWYCWGVFRVVM
ncbi:hypothetical protein DL98DRAFT_518416 [Cadophora sp. DSE1049]|nr:hypothetical protein DL98DRAFT_518416 [Cadophora sp. DSE1049]